MCDGESEGRFGSAEVKLHQISSTWSLRCLRCRWVISRSHRRRIGALISIVLRFNEMQRCRFFQFHFVSSSWIWILHKLQMFYLNIWLTEMFFLSRAHKQLSVSHDRVSLFKFHMDSNIWAFRWHLNAPHKERPQIKRKWSDAWNTMCCENTSANSRTSRERRLVFVKQIKRKYVCVVWVLLQ